MSRRLSTPSLFACPRAPTISFGRRSSARRARRARNKLLFRLHDALGCAINISELGPYWKDEALYRCVFTTALPVNDERASLVEGVLVLAGKLAPVWQVGGLGAGGDLWGWVNEGVVVSGVDCLGFGYGFPPAPGS